jgi:hypothetical protein
MGGYIKYQFNQQEEYSMNRYMKFLNIALIFAMLVLCMPMQAFAAQQASIKMEINTSTGVTTFSLPQKAQQPKVMTLIRGEIPFQVNLEWEKAGNKKVVTFLIPGDTSVIYMDNLSYRIVPQGAAKNIWQEAQNHNAVCLKRRDRQPCQ